MKQVLLSILILSTLTINAQRLRPYAGFSLYLDTSFKKSGFGGVDFGNEFKISRHFKPELELSVLFGTLEELTKVDSQQDIVLSKSILSRSVFSVNASLIPKITFGDLDEDDSYLFIAPRFTLSRVQAEESLFKISSGSSTVAETKDSFSEVRFCFGFGLGYDIGLSDENSSSLSVILYYQGIEMGNALNNLKSNSERITTKDVLGAGFQYYFGNKNKK